MVNAVVGRVSNTYIKKKLDLDLKNRATISATSLIEEPLVLEIKALPSD